MAAQYPGGGERERGRVEFVQALRGIAALAVVGYHVRSALGPRLGEVLFGSGYAGVDLFFVISGFIMVHTTRGLAGGRRDAAVFMVKRLARIWPVYVVATFALLAARDMFGTCLDAHGLVGLGKAFAFYPASRVGAPFFGWAPLEVGWTLEYEVWFYVLFALALAAGRARWPVLVALFATTLLAVPLALSGHVTTSAYATYELRPALLELAANPLMWEFAFGVAIGLVYHSRVRLRWPVVRLGFVALAAGLAGYQYVTHRPGGHGPASVGAALALVVLALALADKERALRVPRSLVWLGDISFSLYLFHRVVQLELARVLWQNNLRDVLASPLFVIGSTIACLGAAHASWWLLERRVATWVRDRLLARVGVQRSSSGRGGASAPPPDVSG